MDRSRPVELCAFASYTDVQQAPGQNPHRVRICNALQLDTMHTMPAL